LTWSAKKYLVFEDERTRPVRDLLAALPAIDARAVVDIGCGPGNSTELLAARFPNAAVSGLDNSADMIAAARKRLPAVRFEQVDIESWVSAAAARTAASFDVILANAVLHWIPGHAELFPALVAKLAPGGGLAVQMPDNLAEPAQRLMREIAAEGPWSRKLAAAAETRASIEAADWYYKLLRQSCAKVDVWRTTYYHPLSGGENAIVEWFKGSGLRPFLEPLDDGERAAYLSRYTAAVNHAYPPLPDGTVLLPFPRLFVVAIRQGASRGRDSAKDAAARSAAGQARV
jgi:trans-aconitate 2-methyltransferase